MVEILEKGSFSVIGKLGRGTAKESLNWIPPLWQAANSQFAEISSLAKQDSEGRLAGIWGAMSDVSGGFARWGEEGLYLAGCEVREGTAAPEGWTLWTIPSFKYAVVKCSQASYQEIFHHMLSVYLPEHQYTVAGAIHEYFEPGDTSGDLYLYFPVEKL